MQKGLSQRRARVRGCVSRQAPSVPAPTLTGRSDEYCPHCDNHFVLEAKTPKASLQVEGEDVRKDSRYAATPPAHHGTAVSYLTTPARRMLKDDRVRSEQLPSISDVKEASYKLG